MTLTVHGLYVPLLTPLREDGGLDLDAIPGHVDRMLAAGVDGLLALGTTGEFADLTVDERAAVVGAVVGAARGRVPVLAGVGAIGATEALVHAGRAAEAGADGLLCLPPLYWKLGDDGVFAHFAAVAAGTDLPLLLYDFPGLSGTPLSPGLVERVARELETFVGIKMSGPELRAVTAVLDRVGETRPEFAVMVGSADLVLPSMLAGAQGTIAAIANVDPVAVVELVESLDSGDVDVAAEAHRRVLSLLRIPGLCRPPVLALKAAAGVFGSPIAPVVRTAPAEVEAVVAEAQRLAQVLAGGG